MKSNTVFPSFCWVFLVSYSLSKKEGNIATGVLLISMAVRCFPLCDFPKRKTADNHRSIGALNFFFFSNAPTGC